MSLPSALADEARRALLIGFLAAAFTVLPVAPADAAGASGDVPLRLAVTIEDHAGLPPADLLRARRQTSRIFRTAGVEIEWNTAGPTGYRISLLPPEMAARFPIGDDALGSTPTEDGPRSRRAYVFTARVAAFADLHHIDPILLLGSAMAHELGHLLLPAGSHSPSGIMRARWDASHLPLAGSDGLHFTREQAAAIRARLLGTEAPRLRPAHHVAA